VPLPAITIEELLVHRNLQDEYRRQFGMDYHRDLDLVFGTVNGDYLKPNRVTASAAGSRPKPD
jgi:hypothetical protein